MRRPCSACCGDCRPLPEALLLALRYAFPQGRICSPQDPAAIPAAPGAYALILTLGEPLPLLRPRPVLLEPGVYVYAGSARGCGGLRARLSRHFRGGKPHWHIDRISARAREMAGFAIENGNECAIVVRLAALPGFRHPVPGFGSSDCPACPSHLLAFAP